MQSIRRVLSAVLISILRNVAIVKMQKKKEK